MPTQHRCQGSQSQVGPGGVQDGHLEGSFLLSVTWCRSPMTKSEILLQQDFQNPQMQTHTIAPKAPKDRGKAPEERRIHVRTYSTHYRVSLARQLLPRPWALKTIRPLTSPRGFPVSHYPEVPWDMQLAHLPCSLLASSLAGSSGPMVRHVYPPGLSSPFCTFREAGWKCL